jgi:hypothetical protein
MDMDRAKDLPSRIVGCAAFKGSWKIKRFDDRGTMLTIRRTFTGRDRRPAVGGYQGRRLRRGEAFCSRFAHPASGRRRLPTAG